jgi:hypothetical protein
MATTLNKQEREERKINAVEVQSKYGRVERKTERGSSKERERKQLDILRGGRTHGCDVMKNFSL